MTEATWLTSTDPVAMLRWLQTPHTNWFPDRKMRKFVDPPGRFIEMPSDRQTRLFAVACCRQIWHLLTDERDRRAVEIAERYADGKATADELSQAYWRTKPWTPPSLASVHDLPDHICDYYGSSGWPSDPVHAVFLRDIFGNPFRPLVVCPEWLCWQDKCIVRLAKQIHDERAFDRMPILADALEEAGCDDADILAHCRGLERAVCHRCDGDGEAHGGDRPFEWSPDPDYMKCPVCKGSDLDGWRLAGLHARGCHVLDLLLGKE